MKKSFVYFLATFISLLFYSCVKDTVVKKTDEVVPPITTGEILVNFNAIANAKNLIPKNKWYSNTSSEVYTVTKLTYYISNVKLTSTSGKVYIEPESYHLIKHVDSATTFLMKAVPVDTYSKIEFLIGVDSTRNVSGAQTGALDPANNMFWEWKSGYIFFKLEGSYASATINEMEYALHIGGFKGKFSTLQTCSMNLNTPITSQLSKTSKLYVNVNVDEIFKTPTKFSLDQYYLFIGDSMFNLVSKNYKNMFVLDKVEN